MTSDAILRFEGLQASYGRRVVFRDAALTLNAGIHALQAPNGFGKSTILLVLAGALPADTGVVWIDGQNLMRSPEVAKRRLSYVPDECPIYPFMTGREMLDFVASVKRSDVNADVLALIERFELSRHLDTQFGEMSLGTQRKVMLSAAWIGAPRVILLDEPTNGLDLAARTCLVEHIRKWGKESTILFTAHDADFVTQTSASVIPMQHIIGSGDAAQES